ncbi:DNA repair protein RecN [Terriglobus albidus]|uniref:DNA repair protein RecN n=1 Tax=Terriglobus albidus TaxID=1592106 RepID=UPI0021E0F2BA|nr:DNA repair protein RecN [Terriglobus albidus]
MLLELRAENYAVMDHAVAGFGPGLNLLTGETGAGKSILIDALALLMGGKASSDVVRHGAEKAVVSCVFEATPGAEALLEENGIDIESDEILLRREIALNGKGRVWVNNQPATVAVLRQLAPELALIHAQSDTLAAFDQAQQRGLLDRYLGEGGSVFSDVSAAYATWNEASSRLRELEGDEQDRLRSADLWSFQAKEIEDAGLTSPDEDTALETEKRVLANSEKLYSCAMTALDLLYEGEGAAASKLGAALRQVEELARFDVRFADSVQQLAGAKASVEDVGALVRDYADGINASPQRLEEIEDRLALLDRLKRKYGRTLAEVIAHGEEVTRKLGEIENRDELVKQIRKQLEAAALEYRLAAGRLTAERKSAAARLEKVAEKQINDLAMKVRFEVKVTWEEDEGAWTAHGWDNISFLIATNVGAPLAPLTEIASGGEMSRVMLALKVSVEDGVSKLRKKMPLPRTLIFDEIDIGIGGRAAEAVGRKLKQLSKGQQVLCITHLPQIAAFADTHLVIEKTVKAGKTRTGVRETTREERVDEIARMLSGATITEASRKNAEQMIGEAEVAEPV